MCQALLRCCGFCREQTDEYLYPHGAHILGVWAGFGQTQKRTNIVLWANINKAEKGDGETGVDLVIRYMDHGRPPWEESSKQHRGWGRRLRSHLERGSRLREEPAQQALRRKCPLCWRNEEASMARVRGVRAQRDERRSERGPGGVTDYVGPRRPLSRLRVRWATWEVEKRGDDLCLNRIILAAVLKTAWRSGH